MLQSFPDNQHAEELIALKWTARAPKSPSNVSPDDRRQSSSSSSEVNSTLLSLLCSMKLFLPYINWYTGKGHDRKKGDLMKQEIPLQVWNYRFKKAGHWLFVKMEIFQGERNVRKWFAFLSIVFSNDFSKTGLRSIKFCDFSFRGQAMEMIANHGTRAPHIINP